MKVGDLTWSSFYRRIREAALALFGEGQAITVGSFTTAGSSTFNNGATWTYNGTAAATHRTALGLGTSSSPTFQSITTNQGIAAGNNITTAGSVIATGAVRADAYYTGQEQASAPAAPATNFWRLYAVDTGGKTELLVRFATGLPQRVAIEP